MKPFFLPLILLAISIIVLLSACKSKQQRDQDIIYGRKFGTALTMDVMHPAKPNGAGVIWISGGWTSSHPPDEATILMKPFLEHGYTVFAVVHGSSPRYCIPDILDDLRRAIRFIRTNAAQFDVNAESLGVHGASSGGHLALLLGTMDAPGDPNARDPVDRQECKVQAVAAMAPPCGFLNYGEKAVRAEDGLLKPFAAAFDYQELDDSGRFRPILDKAQHDQITARMCPVNNVTAGDAATILFHGDKDQLVPLQQSTEMIDKLKQAGVPCELVVKTEGGHDFRNVNEYLADVERSAKWFDVYLRHPKSSKS